MQQAAKLLLRFLLFFSPLLAFAGTTNTAGTLVQYDGSNLFILRTGTQTNVLAIGSDDVGATIQKKRFGSGYIVSGETQDFTATAGFEVVTNITGVSAYNIGTLTHTSLTANADGTYMLIAPYSFTADAGTECHMHAYTNGVIALNVCGRGTVKNAQDYGSIHMAGTIRMYSNDTVTIRMDVDDNVTVTWDHGSATLLLLGPIDSAP